MINAFLYKLGKEIEELRFKRERQREREERERNEASRNEKKVNIKVIPLHMVNEIVKKMEVRQDFIFQLCNYSRTQYVLLQQSSNQKCEGCKDGEIFQDF